MMVPARSDGFTIVELLVAMAITAVLAALMLSVTNGVLSIWSRSQDQAASEAEAGLVFDYLARDLSSAVYRADGGNWLVADITTVSTNLVTHGWLTGEMLKPATSESVRLVPNSVGPEAAIRDARFGLSGVWLRFITTNVESGASLPVAVSYQVAHRPVSGAVNASNPAAVRYSLFRSAVSENVTFVTGYDLLSGYGHSNISPPAQRSAGTVTNPNTAGDLIAPNVVDFGIWFYREDASGALIRVFPVDDGDRSHAAGASADFPAVADVMLRILTPNGAATIAAMESGGVVKRPADFATDAEWWWAVVEANSRVYVRRLTVRIHAS